MQAVQMELLYDALFAATVLARYAGEFRVYDTPFECYIDALYRVMPTQSRRGKSWQTRNPLTI